MTYKGNFGQTKPESGNHVELMRYSAKDGSELFFGKMWYAAEGDEAIVIVCLTPSLPSPRG